MYKSESEFIARLGFELSYYDVAVMYINLYATGAPSKTEIVYQSWIIPPQGRKKLSTEALFLFFAHK